MKKNPFRFGSIVEEPFFINRNEEQQKLKSLLMGDNHIIMMSPRRYGKTSLVCKVVNEINAKHILLDLQIVTSTVDLAGQLLKRIYRIYPFERIKQSVKNFRIIPSIKINPLNNDIDVSFNPDMASTALEDVLNLFEKLGSKSKKLIVVFDEFQEIKKIDKNLDRIMRSVMQYHQHVNYMFLGSQESLLREIFEKKKSPFYHFGYLFLLDKIPVNEFLSFLKEQYKQLTDKYESVAESILTKTGSHPYYTQQLAFTTWEVIIRSKKENNPVKKAEEEIIMTHDMDYERIWNTMNNTDKTLLIGMSTSESSPLSLDFSLKFNTGTQSTVYSAIKRLMKTGYVNKIEKGYEIDDPFFKKWIIERRSK